MFATVSRVSALNLFLLASGTAQAQGSGGTPAETFPWSKVVQIVEHFEEISPQPPPLETVLLGTFDAATGDFIWGPTIELWEVPVDVRYDDITYRNAFDAHGIAPVNVDLAPQIGGLATIGISTATALQAAGNGAHFKPGHGAGKGAKPSEQAAAQVVPGQRFRGHPLTLGVMRTFVRAAKVAFVVEVVNRAPDQAVVLSLDGSTVQANADLIDVIVPPRTRHTVEVRCGTKSFVDKLFVSRPPLIGTFTITALPVTIVYEPPGGTGCTQTYTSEHRAGTLIRSFQASDASATESVDTPITTLNEFCDIASAVGGVAQSIPNPYVSGAGTVVSGASDVLKQAFGSLSINQEVSSTVSEAHTLTLEVTEGSSTWTAAGLGPGQGDAYCYLIEPTFAWIVAQDYESGAVYVSTALLGHHGIGRCSARDLREHKVALPTEMQDQLLALDLLAPEYKPSGKKPDSPSSSRFRWNAPREVPLYAPLASVTPDAPGGFSLTHEVITSDEHVRVDVTTTTTKSTAGFLSYVTNAVPKDEDSRMSLTQGRSSLSSTSDIVQVDVALVLEAGAPTLYLDVGYDRLFGTFTFRQSESQPQFMSGTVSDGSGAPVGSEPMLLTFPDGRSMQARTDKQGKFAIQPPLKVAGPILVQCGGARTTIDWKGTARTGVDLHGATAQAATGGAGSKKTKSGSFPDPKTGPVTASEGSTAGALRGRPASGAPGTKAELQAEIDRLEKQVQELKGRLAALEVGATKPTPAGVRKSKDAGPFEIVADPTMKGRLGRLVVLFPDGANTTSCPIEAFAGEKSAGSDYGSFSKDLMPGEYALSIQNRRLEGIEVRTGHVSRVHVGVLRLQGDKTTQFEIFVPGSKKAFFNCYGPQDVGLPPGEVEVQIAGQRAKIEVVAGKIVEF